MLPLTRATVVRAFAPFEEPEAAERWLEEAVASEERAEALIAEGIDLLNRALHVQAVASGDPLAQGLTPQRAVAARLGYGSGEEVASGAFSAAREIDLRGDGTSGRQRRDEQLRPQERLAAVLGGREQLDLCETLLLRGRGDLDAGRTREAALQLRVGLEALLVELRGALADPDHEKDMATLHERRQEAGELANAALQGDLGADRIESTGELLAICERVIRRRRVLRS
jgi:hypothetical protein